MSSNVLVLWLRGWTQEEVSEACALGSQHYQTVEAARGNLTLTTLARLSKGFTFFA